MIPSVPWYLGAVIGATMALLVEWVNRGGGFKTYDETLLRVAIPVFFLQYGLFCAWRGAPSMMLAWSVYFATTVVLRLALNYHLGETMNTMSWIGTALVIAGAVVLKLSK